MGLLGLEPTADLEVWGLEIIGLGISFKVPFLGFRVWG